MAVQYNELTYGYVNGNILCIFPHAGTESTLFQSTASTCTNSGGLGYKTKNNNSNLTADTVPCETPCEGPALTRKKEIRPNRYFVTANFLFER